MLGCISYSSHAIPGNVKTQVFISSVTGSFHVISIFQAESQSHLYGQNCYPNLQTKENFNSGGWPNPCIDPANVFMNIDSKNATRSFCYCRQKMTANFSLDTRTLPNNVDKKKQEVFSQRFQNRKCSEYKSRNLDVNGLVISCHSSFLQCLAHRRVCMAHACNVLTGSIICQG